MFRAPCDEAGCQGAPPGVVAFFLCCHPRPKFAAHSAGIISFLSLVHLLLFFWEWPSEPLSLLHCFGPLFLVRLGLGRRTCCHGRSCTRWPLQSLLETSSMGFWNEVHGCIHKILSACVGPKAQCPSDVLFLVWVCDGCFQSYRVTKLTPCLARAQPRRAAQVIWALTEHAWLFL